MENDPGGSWALNIQGLPPSILTSALLLFQLSGRPYRIQCERCNVHTTDRPLERCSATSSCVHALEERGMDVMPSKQQKKHEAK